MYDDLCSILYDSQVISLSTKYIHFHRPVVYVSGWNTEGDTVPPFHEIPLYNSTDIAKLRFRIFYIRTKSGSAIVEFEFSETKEVIQTSH